ncbi:MAG: DNA polymerase IV [Dehalococcoidales bacterium]|jgi:DNA polymerase-4|nr:DNA polymerase IV [Dehalococcoidales bacterium]
MEKPTARRIMHIDLDAFFVSVEQVLNPDLQGKPVVVGGKPDRRGVVAAASYEARAFGLHSAMPLTTASRLCPQAIFIEGNFARYRNASQKFMAILADFSPYLEPLGMDEAYLDATGFESIHGSIRQMAVKIRKRVRNELGLCASIGIADSKAVAKIASDRSKPDGLLEVPPRKEHSFLSPLPVIKLPGIGQKSERILNGLGVSTIGQLAGLPLETLKSHFGTAGELLHDHARGIDHRKVEPPSEAKSISRETTFDQNTRDASLLAATLRYLGERVGSDLRRKSKLTKCVTLKIRYTDFTTITRQQTLGRPSDTDQAIFDHGLKLLKKELSQEEQAVRLIGIKVSSLAEIGRQLDMLDPSACRQEKLNTTIDRIRKKYGFTSIQTGRTLRLKNLFPPDNNGYTLQTPSLSR